MNRQSILKLAKLIAAAGLTLAIVWVVALQLRSSWSDLQNYSWTINAGQLVLASAVQLAALWLFSSIWCYLMNGFGYSVPLRFGFKIAYISHLGRYLPGRIWQVFTMMELADRLGIKRSATVASWAISTIFGIPPALLAGLGGMLAFPEMLPSDQRAILMPLMIAAAAATLLGSIVCIVWPNRALGLYNWLLKLIKKEPVSFSLKPSIALVVYVGYFTGWLITGFSFWLFVHAISASQPPLLPMIGGFILAYQVGYFTFFTPGGLGSRELVLIAMLTPFVGPIAAGVALAARVWNLLVEVLATLIALLIRMPAKPHNEALKQEGQRP